MNKSIIILLFIIMFFNGCKSSILDDPSTVINYSIPQRSYIKMTVENSYNTLIATLVDGEFNAGVYTVNFDATNLAEGVYFYTLEIKGLEDNSYYEITKHMLLVK